MSLCPVCQTDVADRDGKCPDCGTLLTAPGDTAQAQEAQQSVDDLLQKGMSAIGTGDHRHGLEYLRAASDLDPSHFRAAEMVGAELLERKKFADAVPYLERAAKIKPDIPRTHMALGRAFEGMQAFGRARQCYNRCLQIDPAYANAKVALQSLPKQSVQAGPAVTSPCVNHMDKRAIAQCIGCGHPICQECCRDVPEERRPLGSDPSEVFYFCENCVEVKGLYVAGQKHAPTHAPEAVGGSTPYNPFAVAAADLAKVGGHIEAGPAKKSGMAFCDMCQCDVVLDGAACPVCGKTLVVDEITKEAQTVERTPEEEFDHGMSEISLGQFDHGMRHLKRACDRDPENKMYVRRAGELLLERKMWADAAIYFKRLVDLEPTRPRNLAMLGKAYKENQQFGDARICFMKALEIEPAFAIAKVELEGMPVQRVKAGVHVTSPCVNHLDKRAIGQCVACGHPLCAECAQEAPEDRRPLGSDDSEKMYICGACYKPKGAYVPGHSQGTTFAEGGVSAGFNPFGLTKDQIREATGASIEERMAAKNKPKVVDGVMHMCPVCQAEVFVSDGRCSVCGNLVADDELAQEAVERTPEEEMDHGMERLSLGDNDHALKHLKRASDRLPTSYKLAAQAGTILYERRKYDDAVVYWARAAEIAERSPKAQYQFGKALQAAGKFAMAKATYEKALALDPSYASAKAALIDLPTGRHEEQTVAVCAFHPMKVAMQKCADCGRDLCASCVRAVPPGRKTKSVEPGQTPYLCDLCLNPPE